jgi:hypothetical protein
MPFEGAPSEIRALTVQDSAWVLSLAYSRYRSFDPGAALRSLIMVINSPEGLALRSEHAFVFASLVKPPWRPSEVECQVLALYAAESHHWEAVKLLRRSIAWAREQNCHRWWFSSETDHDVELLCRRVGAQPAQMRYRVELKDGRV